MSFVERAIDKSERRDQVATITGSFGLLWIYVLVVGVLDETVFGVSMRLGQVAFAAVGGLVLIGWLAATAIRGRQLSRDGAFSASLLSVVTVLSMVTLDVAYSSYLNLHESRSESDRLTDSNSWIGELYPELYYPTAKNFRLFKPSRSVTGLHYGDMYRPEMLSAPTLVASVLSRKHVTVSINEEGFREAGPLVEQKIVALGDSFTFGWGIDQDRTWVERLEQALGEPVYNLGMQDSSPMQEYLLLEHLLEVRRFEFRGGVLLWTIFEGNDLEDSYEAVHARENAASVGRRMFAKTVIEAAWNLPSILKEESVFDKFRKGRIAFASAKANAGRANPYEVDGVQSAFPLYRSERFGLKLFHPEQIERARNPQQYVDGHPNRARIQETFSAMAALARRHGIRVIVVVAPTDARMYGASFDDFPGVSEKAYFNDVVAELGAKVGFEVLNLQLLMQPYAKKELLYFRDDDHWSDRGHEVVAEIISRFLARSQERPYDSK